MLPILKILDSYTQFLEHFKRKYAVGKGSMKLTHNPGDAIFIDFTGKKLHITEQKTSELIPVQVLVSILPYSQYAYVEACLTQQRKDLISCCVNMLNFFDKCCCFSRWVNPKSSNIKRFVLAILLKKDIKVPSNRAIFSFCVSFCILK